MHIIPQHKQEKNNNEVKNLKHLTTSKYKGTLYTHFREKKNNKKYLKFFKTRKYFTEYKNGP